MRANLSSRDSVPAASRRSLWAELTQNRIVALVLAMIVAVPLLAAPADRNLTGIAALTLESFALVLMTALLWRAKWDLRAENVRRFFATGANLPIVLLLGAMTISCVFSPSKLFSIQEFAPNRRRNFALLCSGLSVPPVQTLVFVSWSCAFAIGHCGHWRHGAIPDDVPRSRKRHLW